MLSVWNNLQCYSCSQPDNSNPSVSQRLGIPVDWILFCYGDGKENFNCLPLNLWISAFCFNLTFLNSIQANWCWCWGFLPGPGVAWLMSGELPPSSLHWVPWQGNMQLLPWFLQLLAGLPWPKQHVWVNLFISSHWSAPFKELLLLNHICQLITVIIGHNSNFVLFFTTILLK